MEEPVICVSSGSEKIRQELAARLERHGCKFDGIAKLAGCLRACPEALPDLVLVFFGEGAGQRGESVPPDVGSTLFLATSVIGDAALKSLSTAIDNYLRRRSSSPPTPASTRACTFGDEPKLVGDSPSMRQLWGSIQRVSASDANVLITGETGTGKEIVAQLIRLHGARRAKPFICVNCAAIPDNLLESELFGYERGAFTGAHGPRAGMLEQADSGTVFFDEIGDMSPYAQAKILRAIESKEVQRLGGKRSVKVDVRIIAATNRELDAPEGEHRFRRDLYFRLNVARIHLAPLRERKSDIPLLIRHYVREMNHQFGRSVEGVAPDALRHLTRYDWPGNVRELKNVLEGMFVDLAPGPVQWMQLPEQLQRRILGMGALPPSEQDQLLGALGSTGWNKSKAARQLQWSRMTVYRKMDKYNLRDREPDQEPTRKPRVRTALA